MDKKSDNLTNLITNMKNKHIYIILSIIILLLVMTIFYYQNHQESVVINLISPSGKNSKWKPTAYYYK